MINETLDRKIKVHCPEHHTTFETARRPKIVCEIREHSLSDNFPLGEFWGYCCDCQTFFPSNLEIGGEATDSCRQCGRATTRRFVCNECKIIAFDSDEETVGEIYEINSVQGIQPNCPGCRKHFTDEIFQRHICSAAKSEFLTAREQCPFCKKNILKFQAKEVEESKPFESVSPSLTLVKCPNCGMSNSEQMTFCGSCGQPINNLSSSSSSISVTQQVESRTSITADVSNKSYFRSNQPLMVGLVMIGVISIIVIFVIVQKNQGVGYSPASNISNNSPSAIQANNFTNSSISSANSPPKNFDAAQLAVTRQEVTDALTRWKSDAEALDFSAYMNNYADSVDYYRVGKSDRSRVAKDKQRAFRLYDSIKIGLKNIQITLGSEGNKATVIVDKSWNFKGGQKATEGEVQQQLMLAKISGRWYITGEKDVKVYYTKSY